MKNILLGLLALTSISAFAQGNLSQRVHQKAIQVEELVRNNIGQVENRTKMEVDQILSDTLNRLSQILRTQPEPQYGMRKCGWFDGQSHAISERGWHKVSSVRGIILSERFYGNNGDDSSRTCYKDLVNETVPNHEVSYSKQTSCACQWLSAESSNLPQDRGWHMAYDLQLQNGESLVNLKISSEFFGNYSVSSEESCKRKLVSQNFVCR